MNDGLCLDQQSAALPQAQDVAAARANMLTLLVRQSHVVL